MAVAWLFLVLIMLGVASTQSCTHFILLLVLKSRKKCSPHTWLLLYCFSNFKLSSCHFFQYKNKNHFYFTTIKNGYYFSVSADIFKFTIQKSVHSFHLKRMTFKMLLSLCYTHKYPKKKQSFSITFKWMAMYYSLRKILLQHSESSLFSNLIFSLVRVKFSSHMSFALPTSFQSWMWLYCPLDWKIISRYSLITTCKIKALLNYRIYEWKIIEL